uniref:type I restriction enzyme endonuclease domain-containing protein n=1 Tax=Staphylococcus saprophyticus TaxID=29385 RepID=UPI0011A623B0
KSIQKYNNPSIQASKVIQELIQMPKQINQQQKPPNHLPLITQQIPFYHPLPSHQPAKHPIPHKQLTPIPHQ